MLKYSIAATALLALVVTACLDDPTSNFRCEPYTNAITGTAGDTIVTEIGLRYLVLAEGTAQQEARWCSAAQVQYTGRLMDGTVFDSGTSAFTPGVDPLIAGFAFGIVGMRVDEVRRLIVPAELGYAGQPQYDRDGNLLIPPNSALVFDVELIAVQ